jgi:hypothetical protein
VVLLHRLLDRLEGVGAADEGFDGPFGGMLQQWQC